VQALFLVSSAKTEMLSQRVSQTAPILPKLLLCNQFPLTSDFCTTAHSQTLAHQSPKLKVARQHVAGLKQRSSAWGQSDSTGSAVRSHQHGYSRCQ
jgi:hypothetical protein